MVREWERHENFHLYEDALPALAEMRRHGLRVGLISNGQRDLAKFADHHGLDVDVTVGSPPTGGSSRTRRSSRALCPSSGSRRPRR